MATAAATSSVFPLQQEAGEAVPGTIPQPVSGSGWHSSGSIGPFFAVISVLAVLAIASCAIGRAYSRRMENPDPLESINRRSCFGWMKDRWHVSRSFGLGASFKSMCSRKEHRVGSVGNDGDGDTRA